LKKHQSAFHRQKTERTKEIFSEKSIQIVDEKIRQVQVCLSNLSKKHKSDKNAKIAK